MIPQKLLNNVLLNNIKLHESDLVLGSFGNLSLRYKNFCMIKPSGIDLMNSKYSDMSVIDIYTNLKLSGYNPSSDTPTHIELFKNFEEIRAVAHTHSKYATAWAQAVKPIPCMGTTHADYWKGEIPVTRLLTEEETKGEYELETGKVIVETIKQLDLDPLEIPGILVAHHGPFTWGRTAEEAVYYAEILEYVAKLSWLTLQLNPEIQKLPKHLHERHYFRKHGPDAYYGQKFK